jgi:hypothetical protein
MLDYVYGHDKIVADFVAELIPHCRRGFGEKARAIGIVKDTHLIAGICYHNWDPEAGIIEISGAALPGSGWMTRETIKRMYQFPFIHAGCQMVVNRVPADDERQLRQLAAYDYTFLLMPRLFGRDRDGVICSLTREAWEANKFNRRLAHHHVEPTKQSEAA